MTGGRGSQPAAGRGTGARERVVDERLTVDGQGEGLADLDVLEVVAAEVEVDEVDAQGVVEGDAVLDVGVVGVLRQHVGRDVAPVNVAVLEGHELGVVVVVVDDVELVEGRLAVVVVGELLELDLGGVVVLDDLVLAGADAVGAPAPLVASLLAGLLREDLSVVDAQVVDEGDHRGLEDEGEVGVVLDGEALELGGGAGEHVLGALDEVIHVGGLGRGLGLEHALERVLDVVGGQRGAVVALDALLEGAVQGHAVGLEGRDLGEQARDELVVLGPAQGGLEDAVRDGGGAGVGGLLHVQAELGVGLAEAQHLLLGAGIGAGAVAGATAGGHGEHRRGGAGEGGALDEVTAGEVSHVTCLSLLPI